MPSKELSPEEISKIKNEVKRAAEDHLKTTDAPTALSHFTKDVIAVSNDKIFSSYESLAKDVKAYYKILKKVNYAGWDETHVRVLDKNTATFTARFRYGFTDINNKKVDLSGVWTAVFVCVDGDWKINLRHENFIIQENT